MKKMLEEKLAEILAVLDEVIGDQKNVSRSEAGDDNARAWAALRGATPLRGWMSVDEAEKQLAAWFDRGMSY